MPHCVSLLRIRCCVRADAGPDGELHREREWGGGLRSQGWCCTTASLQGRKHWSLIDLALSEVIQQQWACRHWLRPCIHLPVAFPPEEKKIHMSPAIYGPLHTRYHTWISYPVGVSGALSQFDKAPVFVCLCMSTHGGPGGGRTLFMHQVVVSQVIADFLLPWCVWLQHNFM